MIDENNQQEVEEIEELPEVEEGQEDTTDYKALALKMQGMAKRFQTKIKKLAETPPARPEPKVEKEEKKEILDRMDKAVLTVRGITEPEERAFIEKTMVDTGKPLDDLLDATWFKAELAEFREKMMTDSVLPKGTKRSSQAARDSVDYWIKKGELPPRNQTQLRRDVVNAKMKQAKDGNIFSDNPIA